MEPHAKLLDTIYSTGVLYTTFLIFIFFVSSAQMTVSRWSSGMSADYEDFPVQKKVVKAPTKVPKIVTF